MGAQRFELCDVAATELEQRDSLKVSSQSPYLLPSEGHGEVQEEEKRKKRHICVCCDLPVCQLACVCVIYTVCACTYGFVLVCVCFTCACVQTDMFVSDSVGGCEHVRAVHSPVEHVGLFASVSHFQINGT